MPRSARLDAPGILHQIMTRGIERRNVFQKDNRDVAYIRKVVTPPHRGRRLVERMRGRATVKMSTDEIMALTRGEQ